MKLLRFTFALVLAAISAHHVSARVRGSIPAPTPSSIDGTVLNGNFSGSELYLNIAKAFSSFTINGNPLSNFNADQYPVGVLTNAYGGNVSLPNRYYGHYVTKWTGTAGLNFVPTAPTLVYSGGAGVFGVTPANTGQYFGAPTFINNGTQNVEWAFGFLINGVTTDGSNNVVFTTGITNGMFNVPTGSKVKFSNLTGLGTGPNADGSWTVTKNSNTQITLQSSAAFGGLVAITATGGAGVQTEGIMAVEGQVSVNFPVSIAGLGSVNYSFSDLIFCRLADLADINSGKLITQTMIDMITTLKPKYVRFMDMLQTQAGWSNWSQRAPVTSMIYANTRFDPTTQGTVGGAGDAYTITNPSGSGVGAYADGEVVQFTSNRDNVTRFPTLNVGGRGAAPIYMNTGGQRLTPLRLILSGTTTTGDVISIKFDASYFAGATYTFQYTVLGSDTNLTILAGHIVTALQADATLAANGYLFGNSGGLTAYYIPNKGALAISSSTSGAGTEILTPSQVNLAAIVNGTTYTFIYSVILGGWMFTTDNVPGVWAGPPFEVYKEIMTRANVGGFFTLPTFFTSASAASIGAWAATNLGSLPVVFEWSNEIWNNVAAPYNQSTVLGVALGFTGATGSDAFRAGYSFHGLRHAQLIPLVVAAYTGAGGAAANIQTVFENWALDGTPSAPTNGSMQPYSWNGAMLTPTPATATGTFSAGTTLTIASINSTGVIYPAWDVSGSCVTAGTKIAFAPQHGNGVYTVDTVNSNGTCAVTISNPTYSAVGGIDGASTSTAYNAFPTRPIDLSDAIGYAIYKEGALARQGAGTWTGTQSFYNTLFQASADYATGVPASMQSALDAWAHDLCSGTRNSILGTVTIASFLQSVPSGNYGTIKGFDNFAAGYDGARPVGKANLGVILYEGSTQQTLAANAINGTTLSSSPADLNTQFTNNGWTLSPTYGASNLAVATNIVTLFLAYTNSAQYRSNELYLIQQAKTIHAARPYFNYAQFGVNGPGTAANPQAAPLWGLFPGGIQTTPLGNYLAQADFNAGTATTGTCN